MNSTHRAGLVAAFVCLISRDADPQSAVAWDSCRALVNNPNTTAVALIECATNARPQSSQGERYFMAIAAYRADDLVIGDWMRDYWVRQPHNSQYTQNALRISQERTAAVQRQATRCPTRPACPTCAICPVELPACSSSVCDARTVTQATGTSLGFHASTMRTACACR